MNLRMTYDLTDKFPHKDFSQAARGLSYLFSIKTAAPVDEVIQVAQLADKGCHTVNSMRKRMPVAGKIVLNEREYEIVD